MMTSLLTDVEIRGLRPLGMTTRIVVREELEGGMFERLILQLFHPGTKKKIRLNIQLPVFNDNVITWRNSKKALTYVACVQADSDFEIFLGERDENERMNLSIRHPKETARREIETAIAGALRSWIHNSEDAVDESAVQASIDKWFASGKEWRVLKMSSIAEEDQKRSIIIEPGSYEPSHMARMMARVFAPSMHGKIDLNSTSIGNRVNEAFRLSDGATIVGEDIVAAPHGVPFCSILTKHAVGLSMGPRRAYLLRNSFEQAVPLVMPEEPLVTPYKKGEENMLPGVNLITAVMHLGVYTHEDGIAISQSAAEKMMSRRVIAQLVESHLPVVPIVNVGDKIDPNAVLAIDGEKVVLASKLYYPAEVDKLKVGEGNRLGKRTNRAWFKFGSYTPMMTGDKITNRHGGKGVVTIIPDKDMPHGLDDIPIDICIGPETLVTRKAMGILWEMMVSLKASENGVPIHTQLLDITNEQCQWHKDPELDFKELAKEYGKKKQLILHGKYLSEPTFVGPLFWLRLDKIAREIVSCTGTNRRINNYGGTVDRAKQSGQRCNPAKLLAMQARGLFDLSAEIIDENMSAVGFFKELIKTIKQNPYD